VATDLSLEHERLGAELLRIERMLEAQRKEPLPALVPPEGGHGGGGGTTATAVQGAVGGAAAAGAAAPPEPW
jgi:hypothetical protein